MEDFKRKTVANLIGELSKLPQDAPIGVAHIDDEEAEVDLYFDFEIETLEIYEDETNEETVEAVVIYF